MNRFRLSRRAQHDLESIRDYVSTQSVVNAIRLTEHLHDAFVRLTRMPRMGRRREDLVGDAELRSWVVFDYLILYCVDELGLMVLRVVHGHQDLRQLRYEDNDWPDTVHEQRLPWGRPTTESTTALLQRAS